MKNRSGAKIPPKRTNSGSYLIEKPHLLGVFTRQQRYVMKKRLDGTRPSDIARERRSSVQAVYKLDYRARRSLTAEQRKRYVAALKSNGGRRIKIKPMSLSFAPNE